MSNSTTHYRETVIQEEGNPIVVEVTTWHDAEGVTRLHIDNNREELTFKTATALLHSLARAVTVLEAVEGNLDYRLCGFKRP